MKILFIRFSAIGDIVWTTPVIRCTKQQITGVEIHFVTKYQNRNLVENNPYIDRVFYLQDSLKELLKVLKNEKYDYVVDLHNNLRSTLAKLYLAKPFSTFNKLSLRRFLYTRYQIKAMPKNLHVVDRMMATVRKLGVVNDGKGLDFFISDNDHVNINEFPEPFHSGYAVYVIGASQPTKKLPMNKMIELCLKINIPIILIGGKEDSETGQKLVNNLPDQLILNASGKYSISQSASIVKQSTIVYGHDTGLTHIAAAFSKKIVSIWGSTSSWGYAPYLGDNVLLELKDLACHPCSKSGRKICPLGHFKCMNDLDFIFTLNGIEGSH